VRTITVTTDKFEGLARLQSKALGRPGLPLVVIPHPLAGLDPEAARERGREVGRQVLALLAEQ
jgi:hypothetical protein